MVANVRMHTHHLSMDIIEVLPAATERLAEYPPWSGTAKPGSTPSSSKSFAVLTPTRCGLLDVRPHDDGLRGDRTAGMFPDKWQASVRHRTRTRHAERNAEKAGGREARRPTGSPSNVSRLTRRNAGYRTRVVEPHPCRVGAGCAAVGMGLSPIGLPC